MTCTETERSWRLLFDIALGYGEWISTQHLSHIGLLSFLRNAELIGPSTSIYSILIERLWRVHCISYKEFCEAMEEQKEQTELSWREEERKEQHGQVLSAKHNLQHDEVNCRSHELSDYGFITFDEFVKIMNILSVRCYQVAKCEELSMHDAISLAEALTFTNEDKVRLKESVEYIGQRYFIKYIKENTIHRDSRISLSWERNKWNVFTNHVIAHVINELMKPVILPLFYRFASKKSKHITESSFKEFLSVILPENSTLQHAVAMSAFHYAEFETFTDICSSLTFMHDNPNFFVTERALGLESFVEILLMLSVMVYSDTTQYPHHVAITSKVWAFCEEFLCPACEVEMCVSDPLFAPACETVHPALVNLYPAQIHADIDKRVLISGLGFSKCFVTPAVTDAATDSNNSSSKSDATRTSSLISAKETPYTYFCKIDKENNKELLEARSNTSYLHVAKCAARLFSDSYDKTYKENKLSNNSRNYNYNSEIYNTMNIFSYTLSNTNREECKIFASNICCSYEELKTYQHEWKTQNVPLQLMHKVKNTAEVTSEIIELSSQYLVVNLPNCVCQSEQFRCFVEFNEDNNLTLIPYQVVVLSLQNSNCERVYSCKTVVITMEQTRQKFDESTLIFFRTLFTKKCCSKEKLTIEQFAKLSTEIGLVVPENATQICKEIVSKYNSAILEYNLFAQNKQCLEAGIVNEENGPTYEITRLSFSQYICCTVLLCMNILEPIHASSSNLRFHLDMIRVCNDLVTANGQSTQLTLPTRGQISSSLLPQEEEQEELSSLSSPSSPQLSRAPYNALLEVPYQHTLLSKKAELTERAEKRKKLLQELQKNTYSSHDTKNILVTSQESTTPLTQANCYLRPLPDYPETLQTKPMLTQYGISNTEVGLQTHLRAMHTKLRDIFLENEVVIHDDEFDLSDLM